MSSFTEHVHLPFWNKNLYNPRFLWLTSSILLSGFSKSKQTNALIVLPWEQINIFFLSTCFNQSIVKRHLCPSSLALSPPSTLSSRLPFCQLDTAWLYLSNTSSEVAKPSLIPQLISFNVVNSTPCIGFVRKCLIVCWERIKSEYKTRSILLFIKLPE